jgi:hypothetical protein
MADTKSDAQGGINQVFQDLGQTSNHVTVTLSDFDTEFNTHARMKSPAKVGQYELIPRGMTALLDAVGKEITQTGEDLSNLPEMDRPGKVLFYVVTDGMENSSTEWKLEKVREFIKNQQERYNWKFSFIGADDAAWYGEKLGTDSMTSYVSSSAGTRNLYGALSSNVMSNAVCDSYVPMPEQIAE